MSKHAGKDGVRMKRIMKHDSFVRITALSAAMLLMLTDSVYAQNVSIAAAAGKNTVDSTVLSPAPADGLTF